MQSKVVLWLGCSKARVVALGEPQFNRNSHEKAEQILTEAFQTLNRIAKSSEVEANAQDSGIYSVEGKVFYLLQPN